MNQPKDYSGLKNDIMPGRAFGMMSCNIYIYAVASL